MEELAKFQMPAVDTELVNRLMAGDQTVVNDAVSVPNYTLNGGMYSKYFGGDEYNTLTPEVDNLVPEASHLAGSSINFDGLGDLLSKDEYIDLYGADGAEGAYDQYLVDSGIDVGADTGGFSAKGLWDGIGGMDGAFKLGTLGLGLAQFGEAKKNAKLQRDLLKQKIASNNELMGDRRDDRAHVKSVFSTPSTGLARLS